MKSEPIDLRSDTVTRPSPGMRQAMVEAELGDDVLGDDPTVQRLQDRVADLLGKEAACFVPSGTMANQTAIRAQTEPGDAIVAHAESHIYHYETGAPAALSGCLFRFVNGPRGVFDADDLDAMAMPADDHFAPTRLVVIENTQNRGGGAVWSLERVKRVADRARSLGMRLHLDGARLWNACIATGARPSDYAAHFDTVSTCFSKGLGAPVGSTVSGSNETIRRVFRFRKMFGGAMRQSGVLAAAALYALDHNMERIAEDHANAALLAEGLAAMEGIRLDPDTVESNIVYFDLDPKFGTAAALSRNLEAAGARMFDTGPQRMRAVTHLDVSRDMTERALVVIARVLRAMVAS